MTEQPDTTAIRAQVDNHGWYSAVILDLCDALDAARDFEKASERWVALHARAEAAEAKVQAQAVHIHSMFGDCRELRARAEVAEADLRLSQAAEQNRSEQADAAEAQRDAACAKEFHHRELIGHLKGRAEGAEARIAAALDAYDIEDAFTAADAMHRALTEGTTRQ